MLSSAFQQLRSRLSSGRLSSAKTPSTPQSRNRARHVHSHRDDNSQAEDEDDEWDDDEDDQSGVDEADPLLPIFSAAHLEALPVFNLTHEVRLLIVQRCDTTLSWEQLRSPQISQFLVKPVQTSIRSSHFSRATLYALLANCLQFRKEGHANPGIVGICNTRALLAELLAMRLLKDFSTRELIDALSYDFDPLGGKPLSEFTQAVTSKSKPLSKVVKPRSNDARTSTLEVAIRAEAKRFLAHPLVVQHLESIWAGSIVFHCAADSLHRYPARPPLASERHYGATHDSSGISHDIPQGQLYQPLTRTSEAVRRSVTLYDPNNASLFKLSRLRVPRYRQLFSTISYAAMLGLLVAVLAERSLDITPLEVVFWFWSAGFMLDELVGFSEQGFGLYIASVWNALDLGILLLLFAYYVLRLYGLIIAGDDRKDIARMAYDVLGSTAVLLFPRLFSALDHYRYFSQLLIAFRLMAVDLAAVLVLIVISCTGFFIAFTFAFGENDFNGRGVVYALFQILIGFSPAAWEAWPNFNVYGKVILALFLIVGHFVIVTILITVLTNSFMAVVKNANEEHQFLFAINTISMVKSDMLFSYIAPTNLIGWIITPLRFIIPFRLYVIANRVVIKATHFPILFCIFFYEKARLSRVSFDPVHFVEQRGRKPQRVSMFGMAPDQGNFAPSRMRGVSRASYQKDRALDEVFKTPIHGSTSIRRAHASADRRASVVDQWMSIVGNEGGASPPLEQPRSILEQLETHSKRQRRSKLGSRSRSGMSASNVSERSSPHASRRRSGASNSANLIDFDAETEQDDIDADDDLIIETSDAHTRHHDSLDDGQASDPFGASHSGARQQRPLTATIKFSEPVVPGNLLSPIQARVLGSSSGRHSISSNTPKQTSSRGMHNRQSSTNTILFNPLPEERDSPGSSPTGPPFQSRHLNSRPMTARRHSPRMALGQSQGQMPSTHPRKLREDNGATRSRPTMPPRDIPANKSVPNIRRFMNWSDRSRAVRREPSFNAMALDLASDIGDNQHNDMYASGAFMPGSFQTSMAFATGMLNQRRPDESNLFGRLALARMNKIEENVNDILKELQYYTVSARQSVQSSAAEDAAGIRQPRKSQNRKERDPSGMARPVSDDYGQKDNDEDAVQAGCTANQTHSSV